MIEIDKKKLKNIQDFIADASFQYGGDSLDILEIVSAIKAGSRLKLEKNGWWFKEYHYGCLIYKCAQCNHAVKYMMPYCENCGAKMEVENDS